MNQFTKSISILASAILIFASCDKNQDENNNVGPNQPIVPENNIQALQDYFSNNIELAKQSFIIDAESGGTITSTSGTQITFYGNSFLNGMAQDVIGNITIELVELFNKSEMLRLNKPTMGVLPFGEQRPLVSGGEFQVKAFQNGNELYLKAGASYTMISEAPGGVADQNMSLFIGEDDNGRLTWFQQDSTNNTGVFADGPQYFSFLNQLNWINCDYFMNYNGPMTTVSAQFPEGFTNNNAMLFISFDGLNSLTGIYGFENGVFTTAPYYELPVGMDIHFIAFTVINDEPHAAIVSATIADGHLEIIPELIQTTEGQFASDLLTLP